MNVIKKYWKWDEKYNNTNIKLGDSIQSLLDKKEIEHIDNQTFEYVGKKDFPWKIKAVDGKVDSIFFRDIFFHLIDESIWEMNYIEFEKNMNKILMPVSSNVSNEDVLYVVFRDHFVAIAGLIRGGDSGPVV